MRHLTQRGTRLWSGEFEPHSPHQNKTGSYSHHHSQHVGMVQGYHCSTCLDVPFARCYQAMQQVLMTSHTSLLMCRHGQGTCQRAALSELLSRWTMSQLLAFFGAWINEDEPLPNGPPPLRLHRIMPLPHALSYPTAPAASQLQPGFTAAQALQCLMVRILDTLTFYSPQESILMSS